MLTKGVFLSKINQTPLVIMFSNALTDYIDPDLEVVGSGENSFTIEVYKNYITVDRKHQHTALIESKTIKVDKDVIVYIHKQSQNICNLECKWLWRDPTIFKNLTKSQASELKEVITRVASALRNLATADKKLEAIRVGRQIWAKFDIGLDVGLDSKVSEGRIINNTANRVYTFNGAERVAANFPDWRIPTVKDFKVLAGFFQQGLYNELTGHLNFGFNGFNSNIIPKDELKLFLEMNQALKPDNGGFYWTSDLEGFEPENDNYGNRKYIYINRFTKKISIEESVNINDNFFSLRLIHSSSSR